MVGVSSETSEKTTILCNYGLFVLFHRDIFVTMECTSDAVILQRIIQSRQLLLVIVEFRLF